VTHRFCCYEFCYLALQIDEETDLDLLSVLADGSAPEGMQFVNTQVLPYSS
jgi:hypothetical protein